MLARAVAVSVLFLSALAAVADRGPSTAAERKQALEYFTASRPIRSIRI